MTIKKVHRLEAEDPAVVQAIYGFIGRDRQGGTIETIPDYVGMSVTPEHGVEWFTSLAIQLERQIESEK